MSDTSKTKYTCGNRSENDVDGDNYDVDDDSYNVDGDNYDDVDRDSVAVVLTYQMVYRKLFPLSK